MKRFILFAHVSIVLTFVIPVVAAGQTDNPLPHYVVIGAFASEKNARFWTDEANTHQYPARFEINPNRNLFYVYVLTTGDRELAVQEALKLRQETKYFDTWVYNGLLGQAALDHPLQTGQDFNPATEESLPAPGFEKNTLAREVEGAGSTSVVKHNSEKTGQTGIASSPHTLRSSHEGNDDDVTLSDAKETPGNLQDRANAPATKNAPGNTAEINDQAIVETAHTAANDATVRAPVSQENAKPLTSEDVVGKYFIFKLFRGSNGKIVEGEVDAIDFEKSRRMATYKGNMPVKVIMPAGKSKQISFICQVFGYRKLQKEFDPNSPSEELTLDEAGNLVVPFELVRLQKGDIAIMYNVFYFKDAAVMRPESRYEVNNLLDLLNENPSYKIRIHGHTNGNAAGKIIRMDKSENFYSLTNTKEGYGSSKKLSEERAMVMKQFLVNSGIAEDRMEIEAWGGRQPIHDKNSPRAHENVRVEIEILNN